MPGKYFFIKSKLNGLVLDIRGSVNAGNDVITYEQKDPDDADNQLWIEDRVDYVIRNKADDNLVLTINGS